MFHLKPLYEKIMLNIIGTDNPALAGGENIQVSKKMQVNI